MRVGQLAYNLYPVKPDSNQAIYSTVAWLSDGLVDRGNDVTLFAAGDSTTKANLVSVAPTSTKEMQLSAEAQKTYYHLLASECYKRAASFDIIHSHFSLISSYYADLVKTPTVQSLHSPIDPGIMDFLMRYQHNYYISFTLAQRKQLPKLNWIANIYHGVDTRTFAFNPFPEDYFLYIGRITEDKGVHLAIEAAKAADVSLIIAGPSYSEEGYWHKHIEKSIDGVKVKYVGSANFAEKIKYYQNAKALLFPTQRIEPFGMVMIEAMSCGTPVIGWNNGSVAEVVQHRETGFVINSVGEMVRAMKSIDKISREATRKRALKFFSVEKMVTGYEKVYLKIMEQTRQKQKTQK